MSVKATLLRARKEASGTQLRQYQRQFKKAKGDEVKSWLDQDVYDLVDLRKYKVRSWVSGLWVLTIKKDKLVTS